MPQKGSGLMKDDRMMCMSPVHETKDFRLGDVKYLKLCGS